MAKVACYLCGDLVAEYVTIVINDVKGKVSAIEFACDGYEAFLAGASYVSPGVYSINL